MEPELFNQKMKANRRILQVSATLLVFLQWTIYRDYSNPLHIRTFLVVVGVGAIIFAFSRTVYLLVKKKRIVTPSVGFDLIKTPDQSMRWPFKVMLGILSTVLILPLVGMIVLLISSYL